MFLAKLALISFVFGHFHEIQGYESEEDEVEDLSYSPDEIELMRQLYSRGKYLLEIFKMIRSFALHPALARSFFKPPHYTPSN